MTGVKTVEAAVNDVDGVHEYNWRSRETVVMMVKQGKDQQTQNQQLHVVGDC